ncbi:hypothetical protein [Apibacter adventoris]|uniref:Uncharacterized protein n=1 Tax=Apibacter adventoris TaxID=1679466 RepID=A0A2S8A8B9_9FLAO|nr:hypothetical protein [Apibacter adventoris]PQL90812.1 hypothetical protein C4S77_10185 [Apibacter adventoris]
MNMTKKASRKIGYYYITINDQRNPHILKDVINHIMSKTKSDRKQTKPDNNEIFYFIDSKSYLGNNTNWLNITFKIGEIGYRPPLIDINTLSERKNGKTPTEGEGNKTHFSLRIDNDKICMLAEEFRSNVSVPLFLRYINTYAKELNYSPELRFAYEISIKTNFMEELKKFNRVNQIEVFYDRNILGSEAFNFSVGHQSEIGSFKAILNADRKRDLYEIAKNIGNDLIGRRTKVNNFRIKGKDVLNGEVSMDWNFIKQRETINTKKEKETGEIVSDDIFAILNSKLHNFT